MSGAYESPEENEWIQPILRGCKLACCDCGLVHNMDYRTYKGRIQFRASRNERSTGQKRRYINMSGDDYSRFLIKQIAENYKESMNRLAKK